MKSTHYRIIPLDPHAHVFEVACTVPDPDPAGQMFRLPAWIPGSYVIREFARHFIRVRAEAAGAPVAVRKTAKDLWQAAACSGPLCLIAEVYAFDLSVRAAYLDQTRGYFNGPAVFVWPVGREDRPCEVEIFAPAGDAYGNWRVATSLSRAGAAPYGFGTYAASNYDDLIDHPVEMGGFVLAHCEAGGAPHDISLTGRLRCDLERLARDFSRLCQTQIDLFGGAPGSRAPLSYYLFQVLAVDDAHGGLEHRASTSLVCRRDELPQPGAPGVGDEYRALLGLASHEYFHTWNVKRIKPAAFVPYDLTRENYTALLWAFEGITSYYDDLILVRSELIGVADYLELVSRSITTLLRTPARVQQSVAESSFDAWIKYYRQDENAPNAIVSYYVKGSLIALALDLTLRLSTAVTLDDVMRALWRRYGQTGAGVPEGGIEAIASEVSGLDLSKFFADYVYGTRELPLADLLQSFAVEVNLRPREDDKDKGGRPARKPAARIWLGATVASGADLRVGQVFAGGPAARAGLATGDVIVAVDGLRASPERLQQICRSRAPGELVSVHAFRRGELSSYEMTLEAAPADTCWLALAERADSAAIARRDAWLGRGSTVAAEASVKARPSGSAAPTS